MRDLKEDGLIKVKWIPTEDNSSDLFTKNLFGPLFEKHASVYVGVDKYMQYVNDSHGEVGVRGLQGESVAGQANRDAGRANQGAGLASRGVNRDPFVGSVTTFVGSVA